MGNIPKQEETCRGRIEVDVKNPKKEDCHGLFEDDVGHTKYYFSIVGLILREFHVRSAD